MEYANLLRQKARQARALADKPRGRGVARSHGYLLQLAADFEAEASRVEAGLAGNKPTLPAREQQREQPTFPAREAIDPGPLVG
jgi:hypothetical protein